MLEIKYIKDTSIITAWAGSPKHTGGHYEPEPGEAVAVLDIPNPEKPPSAYLYDEATQSLMPNPDYVEPEPLFFNPANPALGVEQRLNRVEEFLQHLYPPPD